MNKDEITAEVAARLVAAQFPQWAALPVTPVTLNGQDNTTFRLGDELSIGVAVSEMSDLRIRFVFEIRERGTERLICNASYRVACVNAQTFAPQPFPPQIVRLLEAARIAEEPGPRNLAR